MHDHIPFDDALRTVWRYPGGEVGVRAIGAVPARLLARVHGSDELLALLMYLGAVPGQVQHVCIPYLPYARQDRVAVAGDPVAIDVLARLLASTGVRSFATVDAHSDAAARAFAAAGCTLENLPAAPWLARYLDGIAGVAGGALGTDAAAAPPTWFVAPDKGARSRTAAAATAVSTRERPVGVVHCLKLRDPATGALRGFRVDAADSPRELGRDPLVVIVDDICDGGGTFLGVAQALRTAYGDVPLHLWTTHAILSKGVDALAATFATIGATDSFRHGHVHDRLRIVPLRA